MMKQFLLLLIFLSNSTPCFCWGFFAHRKINFYAVFLLPPEMLVLYKPHIDFLSEHAVDPDKRRYVVTEEGPRHYIDLDRYNHLPFDSIPKRWNDAVVKLSTDTLIKNGIVPWWIQTMQFRLTEAFKAKDQARILKLSAEIGHYISDAHVPLHAHSNHNGQFSNQVGIHGFWESRIPELLADNEFDFFIGKAEYISNLSSFIWMRVRESALAADTVLMYEKQLSQQIPEDQKFSFEIRNGVIVRQYSTKFSKSYNEKLGGMIERRMRQSIYAIASSWYTAWVNAGQPDLATLTNTSFTPEEKDELEKLNLQWRSNSIKGRSCDN
jgi:hypothetical protein